MNPNELPPPPQGNPPPPYGSPPPAVPPGYPPPAAYEMPQQLPPLIQPVAPASGSLWRAWVTVATRPARENFAAWSQITN